MVRETAAGEFKGSYVDRDNLKKRKNEEVTE